jgi:hypothetical protein
LTGHGEVLVFGPVNIRILRELHETRPFVPFTLTLADGRKLTVPHNEFFSLFPSGRFAVLTHADDSFTVIELLLVTAVDVKVKGSAAGGRRTKKRE